MSKWYHRTTSTVTFTLCYESDQITAFSHFAVNLLISTSMMSAVNNQLQSTHISRQSINIIWCNVMLGLFHIVRFLEFTPVHCSVSLSTESILRCVLSHTEKFYARDIPHSTCFQWITLDKKSLLGFSIIEICWNIASQLVIFIVTNFWNLWNRAGQFATPIQSFALSYFTIWIIDNLEKKCWNI